MTRPQSEAEYLASLVPASVQATSRRALLRGTLGAGAAVGGAALLSACGGSSSASTSAAASTTAASDASSSAASSPAAAAGGEVSFGSNASDALPKKVVQALADAF